MARTCTVCRHEEREAIHERLIAGEPLRSVAAKFKLSKSAVERHSREHVPELLAKSGEARKMLEGGKLVDRVEELHREASAILAESRADGDDKTALRAIARLERQVALAARILGELKDVQVVEVTHTDEWKQVRGLILAALKPHAAATKAVMAALQKAGGAK
jgi:hypothetical protein